MRKWWKGKRVPCNLAHTGRSNFNLLYISKALSWESFFKLLRALVQMSEQYFKKYSNLLFQGWRIFQVDGVYGFRTLPLNTHLRGIILAVVLHLQIRSKSYSNINSDNQSLHNLCERGSLSFSNSAIRLSISFSLRTSFWYLRFIFLETRGSDGGKSADFTSTEVKLTPLLVSEEKGTAKSFWFFLGELVLSLTKI